MRAAGSVHHRPQTYNRHEPTREAKADRTTEKRGQGTWALLSGMGARRPEVRTEDPRAPSLAWADDIHTHVLSKGSWAPHEPPCGPEPRLSKLTQPS